MGVMSEQVKEALAVEIYDKDGHKHVLGDLVKGKKSAILFVRHFWCGNCQAYVKHLNVVLPPFALPADTNIIIISCGSYEPINNYLAITNSPYPVYANPTLELYKSLGFTSTLAGAKAGEEKDYMKDLGSYTTRVWNSIKRGPLSHISQAGAVGPKSQNGGELVLNEREVLFFHKMENTADHAELKEIAQALGVEVASEAKPEATSCEAGARV